MSGDWSSDVCSSDLFPSHDKSIESLTSQIHKTNEESKGLEFNNYLNELRKDIKLQGEVNGKTVWTKGFDEIFKEKNSKEY